MIFVLNKYEPLCSLGFDNCIYDPSFIKANYPEDYKRLWGDKEPKEIVEKGYCSICGKEV